jgi:hypothetical protein
MYDSNRSVSGVMLNVPPASAVDRKTVASDVAVIS